MIGINGMTLTLENIVTNKASTFGNHEGIVKTLLYDEVTGSLFAGDYSGHIKQYKRGHGHSNFTLLKDYGDVGIDYIISSAQVGRLAFFGGRNHSIVAINISERRVYKDTISSPFFCTFCFQVCHGLNDKVYLSVGGCVPEFSPSVSDLLDVTGVYEKQMMKTKQITTEVNKMLTIQNRKDKKINLGHIKIIKLESDSLKEKTQTEGTRNKKKYK